MAGIKILGTGGFVPPFVAKNEDYAAFIETSDEWITTRTGMKERHIAQGEPTWYMGSLAAEQALEAAKMSPSEIDMVLVTTVTPDFYTPSMACLIQKKLNIGDAIAVDVNVACTGFAYGLDMAYRYLQAGSDVNNVLLVSAESLSQLTNYEDRTTCVLFGDGAGACVITKREDGVYGTYQNSNADGAPEIYAKKPRRTNPFNNVTDTSDVDLFPTPIMDMFYMNGNEVYRFATKAMPDAIELACKAAGIEVSDLDLIIPHQANLRIIQTAQKRLGVPDEKIFVNIEKYGNTSTASASMALNEAVRSGIVKDDFKICAVGFGAGLTYGATVFQY